ncbi:MAG: hypothetical protein R2784_09295 [Saprospiraceae bacterium]
MAPVAGSTMALNACKSETSSGDAPNIQTNKKYRWKMVTTQFPNFPAVGEGSCLDGQMGKRDVREGVWTFRYLVEGNWSQPLKHLML